METRDLVESAAGGPISTVEEGFAVLRRVAPEGNWSVERVEQCWYLLTGDQWVVRSDDQTEFAALVVGAAVAAALLGSS